jgi:alpha-methylacyl-CoA racemase
VAPVYAIAELVSDAQYRARKAFGRARDAEHGEFEQVAPVLAGMHRAAEPVAAADPAVTQSDALLARAGLAPAAIEKLRADGVIA